MSASKPCATARWSRSTPNTGGWACRSSPSTILSPQAALLFNGVKQGANGIEVAIADRQKPLEMLAKRFAVMKEQVEVDVSDKHAQGLAEIMARHSAAAPLRKGYSDD